MRLLAELARVIAILVHVSLCFLGGGVAVTLGRSLAAVDVLVAAGKANAAVFRTRSQQPAVVLATVLSCERFGGSKVKLGIE